MKNLKRSYVACVDHNKVSGMTERNATSMTNFMKYFHQPSSQKPYAATLMAQLNEAKRHLRMMKIPEEPPVVKSQKNKLPERKKNVEDLVGHFFSPLNAPHFFCIWQSDVFQSEAKNFILSLRNVAFKRQRKET